jgi:hypothetical protein
MNLTITAVGDISFNADYYRLMAEGRAVAVLRDVLPLLQSDLVIGNLESPLTTVPAAYPPWRYRLRGEPGFASILKSAGFQVVSLGNNHAMDFGWAGLQETMRHLEKEEIAFVGAGRNLAEARKRLQLEIKDFKVSILSYCAVPVRAALYATENEPGVCPADPELMVEDILNARQDSDLVIVCLHWGEEHMNLPHPSQRILAKRLLSAGTDVLIGHHSHVLQPSEQMNGASIAYSLGNFVFSPEDWSSTNAEGKPFSLKMPLHDHHRRGAILKINVVDKKVSACQLVPTLIDKEGLIRRDNSSLRISSLRDGESQLSSTFYRFRWANRLTRARLLPRIEEYFPGRPPLKDILKVRPRHIRFLWDMARSLVKGRS